MLTKLPTVEDIPQFTKNVPEKFQAHVTNMADKMITHAAYGKS